MNGRPPPLRRQRQSTPPGRLPGRRHDLRRRDDRLVLLETTRHQSVRTRLTLADRHGRLPGGPHELRNASGAPGAGSVREAACVASTPCPPSLRPRPRDTDPRRRPERLPARVPGTGQHSAIARRDPVHQRSPCARTIVSPPDDRLAAVGPHRPGALHHPSAPGACPDPSAASLPVDGRTGHTSPHSGHPVSPAHVISQDIGDSSAHPPRVDRTSVNPQGARSSDAPVVMRDDHRTWAVAVSRETTGRLICRASRRAPSRQRLRRVRARRRRTSPGARRAGIRRPDASCGRLHRSLDADRGPPTALGFT